MIPTREQLEAWANTVDGALLPVFVRNVDGGELDCAVADDARALAAFLRSDALREALRMRGTPIIAPLTRETCVACATSSVLLKQERDRAEAWKALAMDAPRLCYRVLDDGADMETEWYTRMNALLAQEKEQP